MNFNNDKEIKIIPEGIFEIKDTIILNGGLLKGAGVDKTILVADFEDSKKAILNMGWTSKLEDMTICFKQGLVTGKEKAGERVAIYTKSHLPLQKGAYIRNVKIDNVGTGIYSNDFPSITFSVMYNNVSVTNFSYRGFDISSPFRTGNIYSNLYLSSGNFRCDSAFYFGAKNDGDEESETTIDNLAICNTVAKTPLFMESARGLIAKNIVLNNVNANESLIFWQDSDGCIEDLTVKNSNIKCDSIIKIGTTSKFAQWSAKYLHIKKLKLEDLKIFNKKAKLFMGEDKYVTPYYITVDKYNIYNCDNSDYLESFPISGELTFIKKGDPTRPERLCKFYSKKIDISSAQELVWDGVQWC